MTRWLLVQSEDGEVEVRRNDRAHSSWPSLESARSGISAHVEAGDRVTRQEPDGYRVKDRASRRRGWRQTD